MTASTLDDSDITCIVLVNALGEHSLWPACSPVPAGWREVGPEGTADACAAWVDRQFKPPAVAQAHPPSQAQPQPHAQALAIS